MPFLFTLRCSVKFLLEFNDVITGQAKHHFYSLLCWVCERNAYVKLEQSKQCHVPESLPIERPSKPLIAICK